MSQYLKKIYYKTMELQFLQIKRHLKDWKSYIITKVLITKILLQKFNINQKLKLMDVIFSQNKPILKKIPK